MFPSRNNILRRAFTLIELIVVISIILLLVGILVPAMSHFHKTALNAAASTQLHSIRTGLQAYYADFNMYPQSSPGYGLPANSGPEMLAEGLMGNLGYDLDGAGPTKSNGSASPFPGDPAYGFRTRQAGMGGKVYGPYASPDKNGYATETLNKIPTGCFVDPWSPPGAAPAQLHKILYFRSSRSGPGAMVGSATKIFGIANDPSALFYYTDCSATDPTASANASATQFLAKLGASSNTISAPVMGASDYLLISPGADANPTTKAGYFDSDDIVMSNDSQ